MFRIWLVLTNLWHRMPAPYP